MIYLMTVIARCVPFPRTATSVIRGWQGLIRSFIIRVGRSGERVSGASRDAVGRLQPADYLHTARDARCDLCSRET